MQYFLSTFWYATKQSTTVSRSSITYLIILKTFCQLRLRITHSKKNFCSFVRCKFWYKWTWFLIINRRNIRSRGNQWELNIIQLCAASSNSGRRERRLYDKTPSIRLNFGQHLITVLRMNMRVYFTRVSMPTRHKRSFCASEADGEGKREPDTSATRHFGTQTLRHHKIGAEV